MTGDIPTTELCDRYASLYPGAITDVLDDMEYEDQTLDPGIGPLKDHMTTAGIAYPCVGRPNRSVDNEKNVRNILQMLGDAPEDAVVIYETNAMDSAQIGELSVECLMVNGCRGAVLDGGARDLDYILQNDFPVFTRFRTPADAVPRWELLEWDTEAVVGGVEVSPGDVVVGDVDGVVVVPREIAEEVLLEAEELAETEDEVRDAVRDGVHPVDAYEEYEVF
jgi:4-hydroxy-4-methyl-2-oxoglutarate aldolase